MLEIGTNGSPDGPSRLLRPGALLARLRPVHFHRVILRLRNGWRQAKLLGLIERYFPGEFGKFEADEHWADLLADLIKLVENSGWFAVDWPTLDYLWECYMQIGDSDCEEMEDCIESEFLEMMAHFVEYVPVRYYNYSKDEWMNGVLEDMPLLALMRGLVDPTWGQNISNLLIEYELYDIASEIDLYHLPQRCEGLDEPLCWLPVMVNYVRRETGNPLLDGAADLLEWGLSSRWCWDSEQDMAEVRQISAAAQAEWEKIEALLVWADGPELVEEVVMLLVGNGEANGE